MAYYHEENAAERTLRKELTKRGLDFRQSETIAGREIDFYFPQYLLAVEVDGFSHIARGVRDRDRDKERILSARGVTLLRLSNQDVLTDVRNCGDRIVAYIKTWRHNVRRADSPPAETVMQAELRAWIAKTIDLQGKEPPRRNHD